MCIYLVYAFVLKLPYLVVMSRKFKRRLFCKFSPFFLLWKDLKLQRFRLVHLNQEHLSPSHEFFTVYRCKAVIDTQGQRISCSHFVVEDTYIQDDQRIQTTYKWVELNNVFFLHIQIFPCQSYKVHITAWIQTSIYEVILAKCINKIIMEMIHPDQTGLVLGRYYGD